MKTIYPEKLIIKSCINENRKFQEILFKKYYGKIMGVCLRYSKDKSQAQDFLQESFIQIFNNIKKYKGTGSFEGWIKVVTRNCIVSHIRKNKPIYISMQEEDLAYHLTKNNDANEDEGDVELCFKNINVTDIINELQNLTTCQRTIFNLHIVDGTSHKEISKLLNITIGTSKSNLHKAKKNIKKRLLNKLKTPV